MASLVHTIAPALLEIGRALPLARLLDHSFVPFRSCHPLCRRPGCAFLVRSRDSLATWSCLPLRRAFLIVIYPVCPVVPSQYGVVTSSSVGGALPRLVSSVVPCSPRPLDGAYLVRSMVLSSSPQPLLPLSVGRSFLVYSFAFFLGCSLAPSSLNGRTFLVCSIAPSSSDRSLLLG